MSYSFDALKSVGDEGVNLESLLQSLFANEWHNLCERVKRRGDSEDPLTHDALIEWAPGVLEAMQRHGMMPDAIPYDALIECLPSCCSAANPPRHAPVTSGDNLLSKFVKQTTFGKGLEVA